MRRFSRVGLGPAVGMALVCLGAASDSTAAEAWPGTPALTVAASMPESARKVADAPHSIDVPALDCHSAIALTCGADTTGTVEATGGNVSHYPCVGLSYDGSTEAVYAICIEGHTRLQVDVFYDHDSATNDLDLFLLGSCDESDCLDSDIGTSGIEETDVWVEAGTYYAVVDAWDGRTDGSPHSIRIRCDAPCETSTVETAGWGMIKALYRD